MFGLDNFRDKSTFVIFENFEIALILLGQLQNFQKCGALRDLVPFVRFKKREKHPYVLLLVKLQASACNFTKNNTPPWVFFTFFKLCTWC